MERIRIDASRSYDVVIGERAIEKVGACARKLSDGRKCAVIADDITAPLFGGRVIKSLSASGFEVIAYTIPHGEESKSGENFLKILNFLAENGLTRHDIIVSLGGGVVGDLSGFVASSFLRGVKLVQIPTTLLSAVDSSVGGKTAINLTAGKNLAGAFYQPSAVLCDTEIIGGLPEAVFSDGMAEVIKYGAISSPNILKLACDGARKNINEIVSECVKIKRDIVNKDEFDTGLRQLLNLGHTPAHAIEKLSGFSISHGRAVAIGMCIMARSAEAQGLCEKGVADELLMLCERYNLPTECKFTAAEMARICMSDKKRGAGRITLVVPKKRGESVLLSIADDKIEEFLEKGL